MSPHLLLNRIERLRKYFIEIVLCEIECRRTCILKILGDDVVEPGGLTNCNVHQPAIGFVFHGIFPEHLHRAGQRTKLQVRLADLEQGNGVSALEPGRLEQELVLWLQKLDVDEELDRLDSHIIEIKRVLVQKEPIGRRLEFLLQEFNREANTLGSKSVDTRTSQAAVELKVLIDQVREQIQNIE